MADEQSIVLRASGLEFSALEYGPADGSLVLCLHGFPDSPSTFRHQVQPLVEAGFRVVAPTLRGYEPSSQPADGDYSLMALADDVVGWLDDLDVEQAHLVGHDWGAAIVYVAAARVPTRVSTATALAIPPLARIPGALRHVPRQLQRSWYMNFFQLRGVADRALVARDWRLLRRLWRDWSPGYEMSAAEWEELRGQFEQPGVVGATLAYYRQNATPPVLLGVRSSPVMELTEIAAPTLILHGADDGCMDRRLFEHAVVVEDFVAGGEGLEGEGAGHFLHLERPDVVNAAILAHLNRE